MTETNIREMMRELAIEAAAVAKEETSEVNKVASTGKKRTIEYSIVIAEYPDLVIEKKGARASKQLVIMPSTGTVFIKTNKKDGAVTELCTADTYAKFMSDSDEEGILLPKGYWANRLPKGKTFGQKLLNTIEDTSLCDMIRKKVFQVMGLSLDRDNSTLVNIRRYFDEFYTPYAEVYEDLTKVCEAFADDSDGMKIILQSPLLIKDIFWRFGLENAIDFIREAKTSLVDFDNLSYYSRSAGPSAIKRIANGNPKHEERLLGLYFHKEESSRIYQTVDFVIPNYPMKYKSLKTYILYSSVRMGFGDGIGDFFQTWDDTLMMENNIYGKIREKYPEDLLMLHNVLAYKSRQLRDKIDEKAFNEAVENAKKYEGNFGKFSIIAPKTRQDFLDEATQQANCLASYVRKFANGDCTILFMRKKAAPETSYITVEVCEGVVRQACLRSNRRPPESEVDELRAWVAKCEGLESSIA